MKTERRLCFFLYSTQVFIRLGDMMQENTKASYIVGSQINEEDIFTFPGGVPGFEHLKRFVLSEEQEPFMWLNAVDDDSVRFIIVNPMEVDANYNPKFRKDQSEGLQLEDVKDLLIFVIVTLRDPLPDSTTNMAGPILLNVKKRLGKQIILDDPRYSVTQRLIGGE
jgi:flagellar assembly factor FliW